MMQQNMLFWCFFSNVIEGKLTYILLHYHKIKSENNNKNIHITKLTKKNWTGVISYMTGVMRLSTSQLSESDVKVCEFETSKSRNVNPEVFF